MVYADLSVKQIEQMIEKIHLKREGVDLGTLEQTQEPFIRVK
jgi:S-adenosylhomocysteine hydrolase